MACFPLSLGVIVAAVGLSLHMVAAVWPKSAYASRECIVYHLLSLSCFFVPLIMPVVGGSWCMSCRLRYAVGGPSAALFLCLIEVSAEAETFALEGVDVWGVLGPSAWSHCGCCDCGCHP